MTVPTTGSAIFMRGIRREVDAGTGATGYNTGTHNLSSVANSSLRSMSSGSQGTINNNNDPGNRPDKIAPHAISEFSGYNRNAATGNNNFVNLAVKFNGGNPLFRQHEPSELSSRGLTASTYGYVRAYLADGKPYRALARLNNTQGRNRTLIANSNGTQVTSTPADGSFGVYDIATYDYPSGNLAYKGTLRSGMTLRMGTTYMILEAVLASDGTIANAVDHSSATFKAHANYIALNVLLEKNYNLSSLASGTYAFIFNFGM